MIRILNCSVSLLQCTHYFKSGLNILWDLFAVYMLMKYAVDETICYIVDEISLVLHLIIVQHVYSNKSFSHVTFIYSQCRKDGYSSVHKYTYCQLLLDWLK